MGSVRGGWRHYRNWLGDLNVGSIPVPWEPSSDTLFRPLLVVLGSRLPVRRFYFGHDVLEHRVQSLGQSVALGPSAGTAVALFELIEACAQFGNLAIFGFERLVDFFGPIVGPRDPTVAGLYRADQRLDR